MDIAPTAAPSVGREHAAIDAADHHDRNEQDRPHGPERAKFLPAAPPVVLWGAFRAAARHDGDHDAVEQRRHDARHESRHEEFGDVLLGRDGVDDQDHRGRDEDPQGAANRDRAGREPVVVAVTPQFRQRRAPERSGRRHR
jgi:hypothetical protein